MKTYNTYNTYQEAKIANPECEIYKLVDSGLFGLCTHIKSESVRFTEHGSDGIKCNPADHCVRYDDFLTLGHKFVDGDAFLNSRGEVVIITNAQSSVRIIGCANKRFILRAAALEEKPIEKAEWVNGDLVCKVSQIIPIGVFVGLDRTGRAVVELNPVTQHASGGDSFMTIGLHSIKKPETKQQREDRERLEAAYDLYTHVQSVRGQLSCKSDWFSNSEMEETRLRFLAIVDKTNYRKDV